MTFMYYISRYHKGKSCGSVATIVRIMGIFPIGQINLIAESPSRTMNATIVAIKPYNYPLIVFFKVPVIKCQYKICREFGNLLN